MFTGSRKTEKRFWEFFAANIRNPNTRQAYLTAVYQFANWCEAKGLDLETLDPMAIAAYVEVLTHDRAPAREKERCFEARVRDVAKMYW